MVNKMLYLILAAQVAITVISLGCYIVWNRVRKCVGIEMVIDRDGVRMREYQSVFRFPKSIGPALQDRLHVYRAAAEREPLLPSQLWDGHGALVAGHV